MKDKYRTYQRVDRWISWVEGP